MRSWTNMTGLLVVSVFSVRLARRRGYARHGHGRDRTRAGFSFRQMFRFQLRTSARTAEGPSPSFCLLENHISRRGSMCGTGGVATVWGARRWESRAVNVASRRSPAASCAPGTSGRPPFALDSRSSCTGYFFHHRNQYAYRRYGAPGMCGPWIFCLPIPRA